LFFPFYFAFFLFFLFFFLFFPFLIRGQVVDWLAIVKPNAKRVQEHKRKYDRLREEREARQKVHSHQREQ
jgi:hypothetical protein